MEKMVDDGEKDKYLTGKMERERKKRGRIRQSFRNLTKMVEISEKLMYNVFIQEGREDYAAALRTEPAEEPET